MTPIPSAVIKSADSNIFLNCLDLAVLSFADITISGFAVTTNLGFSCFSCSQPFNKLIAFAYSKVEKVFPL